MISLLLKRIFFPSFCLIALNLAVFPQAGRVLPTAANTVVPAPENDLGFKIGTDQKLARWEKFVAYFEHLDAASDRLMIETLGKTTLGKPFIVATISAPENLKRLDEIKSIQQRLADPRLINQDSKIAQDFIKRGKTVIVITCSIHSTEVGGTFTATELAYRLASSNAPEIRQILENTVILLVPSLNPDGTDIIADWYQKTLNTPAEGTSPPELYHHYTGHDNNRDWYAFTQVETQLTVDKILNTWHPNIIHDIHQQGATGSRLFLPPYTEPWEPNIDPAIIAGVNALGSSIAWELTAQGKEGITINSTYDAWSPSRAYAHYHGALRILSETASARLATPVNVPFEKLTKGIGYDAKISTWNFIQPWKGGRWGISNIVDYQTTAAMALLNHAARFRERYLQSFYDINNRAVSPHENVYAFVLPEPEMPKALSEQADRLTNPAKSDNTDKTEKEHAQQDSSMKKIMNTPATTEEVNYYYKIEGLDRVLGILKRGGIEVMNAAADFTAGGKTYPRGTHLVMMQQPASSFAKTMLERQQYPDLREYPGGPPKRPYDVIAHTLPLLMNIEAVAIKEPFTVNAKREPVALVLQSRVRANSGVKLGLYQNYAPSMDEGWTRWMFDQYKFPYTRLKQEEIRTGFLKAKFDAIIIPDQSARAIAEGIPAKSATSEDAETGGAYPAEFTGGLGESGVKALRAFVEEGGTLITFNNASNFAIEKLNLPVRNVVKGIPPKQFYCPGSILRTELDSSSNLTFGMDKESIAWFEQSPAFEVLDEKSVRVIAKYPASTNPMISGWILGDELVRGKAAMVEIKLGKGRIILFGFRPQYRGQSLATYPLIFNSILTSKAE